MLAARLSYASYKVSKGWIQQNINEIEHLQASRFAEQAQRRKGFKGKGKASTKCDDKADISHVENTASGPFAMLADPRGQAVLSASLALPLSPRNQYYGYTAQDIAHTHHSYYNYQSSDSNAAQDLNRYGVATPPPHEQVIHPSPSMYKYIASPIAPSGPWSSMVRPLSSFSSSRPIASGLAGPAGGDFWKNTPEIPPEAFQYTSAGVITGDQHDLGTPGVTSSAGQATQYQMSDPRFCLMPAATMPCSAVGNYVGSPAQRGHLRNRSQHALRAEYSASNITMDDLDSQFR